MANYKVEGKRFLWIWTQWMSAKKRTLKILMQRWIKQLFTFLLYFSAWKKKKGKKRMWSFLADLLVPERRLHQDFIKVQLFWRIAHPATWAFLMPLQTKSWAAKSVWGSAESCETEEIGSLHVDKPRCVDVLWQQACLSWKNTPNWTLALPYKTDVCVIA